MSLGLGVVQEQLYRFANAPISPDVYVGVGDTTNYNQGRLRSLPDVRSEKSRERASNEAW
ncbi:MAG: hypothetical protein IH898_09700 [Planctomycetes bacterium]|nr:hypothetical protein [Planctomycetota bacterium]